MDAVNHRWELCATGLIARIGFAMVPFAMLLCPLPVAAQGSPCLPTDSLSTSIIHDILLYTTPRTGSWAIARDSLRLPRTTNVTLETNPTVCQKGKDAFAAEFAALGSGLSSQVYVIKVGSGAYGIVDPGYRYNNLTRQRYYAFIYFVDSKFRKLSALAG